MAKLKLLTAGAMGALGAAALLTGNAQAQDVGQELVNAVTGGKVHLELRPRYAHINDEAPSAVNPGHSVRNANAFTMRSVLGYETGRFYGFGVYAEAINVSEFGGEAFNDGLTTNRHRKQFAVEADPGTTEINQIYVSYAVPQGTNIGGVDLGGLSLKYGRQHIALQNHRWIGDVGWRQKPQEYDGGSLTYVGPYGSQLFYSYVYNVDRPTANISPDTGRNPKANIGLKAHIINLDLALDHWTHIPAHLIGYGYLFDFDNNQPVPMSGVLAGQNSSKLSNKTLGVRLDGKLPFTANPDGLSLLYTGEYAHQSSYAGGSGQIHGDYIFGQGGLEWYGIHLAGAYELLGGNGRYAVQTPFQTTHAMNGWADRFAAVIPADGLKDIWVEAGLATPAFLEQTLGGALSGIQVLARYHNFSSDHDSYHYGNEFDIQAAKHITEQLSVLLQYADYFGDSGANTTSHPSLLTGPGNLNKDVQKYWVMADYKF
ncbi:MAG TPA: hypothetical protein VFL97_02455 [Nitrococcus sp.]|nr:hypothetical protein [Nitrococcus sp.]